MMRRRRIVLAAALSAAMVAGFIPSSAGPYAADVYESTGALVGTATASGVVPVQLSNGMGAVVFLISTNKHEVRGRFVWPQPDPQVNQFAVTGHLGCILLYSGSRVVDGGCQISPPASINSDPAGTETTISMVVKNSGGYRLIANILLEGSGIPAPGFAHAYTLTPPSGAPPQLVVAEGQVALARGARTILGSVRSDMLGVTGLIGESAADNASVVRGLFRVTHDQARGYLIQPGLDVAADFTENFCLPSSDPDEPKGECII